MAGLQAQARRRSGQAPKLAEEPHRRGVHFIGGLLAVIAAGRFPRQVPKEGAHPGLGHTHPEHLGGHLGQQMGFVEHHGLVAGQGLAVALGLEHQICQKQVMVHHHDVSLGRLAAGLHQKAILAPGAAPTQALLAGGSYLGDESAAQALAAHLVQIAVNGFPGPAPKQGQATLRTRHIHLRLTGEGFIAPPAKVVGAPF